MIPADEFAGHREHFQAFLAAVHRFAGMIFVFSFVGYGAAVWAWWTGAVWLALIVASLSYLFFRQFRRLSMILARRQFASRPECADMLAMLDCALASHKPAEVMARIESLLGSG